MLRGHVSRSPPGSIARPRSGIVLTSRSEFGHDLQVGQRDQRPYGGKDQEVDLGRRSREGVGIIPVGDCPTMLE